MKISISLVLLITISIFTFSKSEPLIAIYRTFKYAKDSIIKYAEQAFDYAKDKAHLDNTVIDPEIEDTILDGANYSVNDFKLVTFKVPTNYPLPDLSFDRQTYSLDYKGIKQNEYFIINFEFQLSYHKDKTKSSKAIDESTTITIKYDVYSYMIKYKISLFSSQFRMFIDLITEEGEIIETNLGKNDFFKDKDLIINDIINKKKIPEKVTELALELYSGELEHYYYKSKDIEHLIEFQDASKVLKNIISIPDSNSRIKKTENSFALIDYYSADIYDVKTDKKFESLTHYVTPFDEFDDAEGDYQIFISSKLFANLLNLYLSEKGKIHQIRYLPDINKSKIDINYLSNFIPSLLKNNLKSTQIGCEFVTGDIEYGTSQEDDDILIDGTIYFFTLNDFDPIVEFKVKLNTRIAFDFPENLNLNPRFENKNFIIIHSMKTRTDYKIINLNRLKKELVYLITRDAFSSMNKFTIDGISFKSLVDSKHSFSHDAALGGELFVIEKPN